MVFPNGLSKCAFDKTLTYQSVFQNSMTFLGNTINTNAFVKSKQRHFLIEIRFTKIKKGQPNHGSREREI